MCSAKEGPAWPAGLSSSRQGPAGRKLTTPTQPIRRATDREAALEARVAQLEDELRARDDFLAIAAHELRNPMTPISARLELLLNKLRRSPAGLPDGLLQGLERLERLVDAYLRRARVLLEVSRINSGNLHLQSTEVDLSALVRQVVSNMMPLAELAGCHVRADIREGITARGDPMAVEQIVENLLSNAIRYGPGRPIEVALSVDDGSARLSVRDEGIGIAQQDQADLFEHYGSARRSKPRGGLGIGLWLTRRLVRAMCGEITVSSFPSGGSTFTVEFPLRGHGERNAR